MPVIFTQVMMKTRNEDMWLQSQIILLCVLSSRMFRIQSRLPTQEPYFIFYLASRDKKENA